MASIHAHLRYYASLISVPTGYNIEEVQEKKTVNNDEKDTTKVANDDLNQAAGGLPDLVVPDHRFNPPYTEDEEPKDGGATGGW